VNVEAVEVLGDVPAVLPVMAPAFDAERFRMAVGVGMLAAERGVWGDVWGAYGRVRVAGGNAEALPLGIDDHLGRLLVAGEGWSVNFHHIYTHVFGRLVRASAAELRSGAAFVQADRIMRGALIGYVRQLRQDAAKVRRERDNNTQSERAAALSAVLIHLEADDRIWSAALSECYAENWIETEDGRRIKLHLDTDIDRNGNGVTVAVLAHDCPKCHGTASCEFEADGFQDEDARVSCVNCGESWDVQGRAL